MKVKQQEKLREEIRMELVQLRAMAFDINTKISQVSGVGPDFKRRLNEDIGVVLTKCVDIAHTLKKIRTKKKWDIPKE